MDSRDFILPPQPLSRTAATKQQASGQRCTTCRGNNLRADAEPKKDILGALCIVCRRISPPFKFRNTPHHCNYAALVESAAGGCYLCDFLKEALLATRCWSARCSREDAEQYHWELDNHNGSHFIFEQQRVFHQMGNHMFLEGIAFWREDLPTAPPFSFMNNTAFLTMLSSPGMCSYSHFVSYPLPYNQYRRPGIST